MSRSTVSTGSASTRTAVRASRASRARANAMRDMATPGDGAVEAYHRSLDGRRTPPPPLPACGEGLKAPPRLRGEVGFFTCRRAMMSEPILDQVREKYAAAAGSGLSSRDAGVRSV